MKKWPIRNEFILLDNRIKTEILQIIREIMTKNWPDKYNDHTNDNVWLHRIANETAKTNALLSQLIDLYLEDNPRTESQIKKTEAEIQEIADDDSIKIDENGKRYRLTQQGFRKYL